MAFAIRRGHQGLHVLAQCLACRVAKKHLGRGAKGTHDAVFVDHDHGAGNRIEDGSKVRLARQKIGRRCGGHGPAPGHSFAEPRHAGRDGHEDRALEEPRNEGFRSRRIEPSPEAERRRKESRARAAQCGGGKDRGKEEHIRRLCIELGRQRRPQQQRGAGQTCGQRISRGPASAPRRPRRTGVVGWHRYVGHIFALAWCRSGARPMSLLVKVTSGTPLREDI